MLALRIHTQFLHTRCTCGSSTTTAVIFDNTCTVFKYMNLDTFCIILSTIHGMFCLTFWKVWETFLKLLCMAFAMFGVSKIMQCYCWHIGGQTAKFFTRTCGSSSHCHHIRFACAGWLWVHPPHPSSSTAISKLTQPALVYPDPIPPRLPPAHYQVYAVEVLFVRQSIPRSNRIFFFFFEGNGCCSLLWSGCKVSSGIIMSRVGLVSSHLGCLSLISSRFSSLCFILAHMVQSCVVWFCFILGF